MFRVRAENVAFMSMEMVFENTELGRSTSHMAENAPIRLTIHR